MTVSKKFKWKHSPSWVRGLFFFWPSMMIVFEGLLITGKFLWGSNFSQSTLGLYFILMTILFVFIWAANLTIFGLGWIVHNLLDTDKKEKIVSAKDKKRKLRRKLKKAEKDRNILDIGENETVEIGDEIDFIASLKEGKSSKKLVWDFDDGTRKKGSKVKHRYEESGVYKVRAGVVDEKGNRYQDNLTISVRNPEEPIAKTGENKIVDVGEEVEFDGSDSEDSIGIENYEWYFDDWSDGNGEKITHTYDKPGIYEVRLIVTDKAGYFDQDTVKVIVEDPENREPIADAGGDKIVDIGQKVKFNASQSKDDVGIKRYEWDFGDGTKNEGEVVRHIYLKPGRYKAKLKVTDVAGNESENTITIKVEGDKQDFLDLMEEVKGIGNSTAQRLYENGYQKEKDVKNASVNELSDVSYVTEDKAERLKEYFEDE